MTKIQNRVNHLLRCLMAVAMVLCGVGSAVGADFRPTYGKPYALKDNTNPVYLTLDETARDGNDQYDNATLSNSPRALYFSESNGQWSVANSAGRYLSHPDDKKWNATLSDNPYYWTVQDANVSGVTRYRFYQTDANQAGYLGCPTHAANNPLYVDQTTDSYYLKLELLAYYTISITGNPSAATVTIGGTQYHDGDVYLTTGETVSSTSITATDIVDYTYTVIVDDALGKIKVTYTYAPKCAKPSVTNNVTCTFSCSHPTSGVTLRYTVDGDDPTSTTGTVGSSVTLTSYNHTIKVIATATGYDDSEVAEYYLSEHVSGEGTDANPYIIENSSQLKDLATYPTAVFKISDDVDELTFPSDYTTVPTFSGTLDGNFKTITGLTSALFASVTGTVKNVILDNVRITTGTNVGAIANEASGSARIYNCGVLATTGSSLNGTTVGSIVGELSGQARVINCFSYANVSGAIVGGIVGKRTDTALARTSTTDFTPTNGNIVFNCVFFGAVSGTSKYPIFGGTTIENVYTSGSTDKGINTYNYFLYDGTTTYTSVNSANATMEKSYFNRFDLYSGILNSHRDLCAMYIYNTQSLSDDQKHDIALWQYDHANCATVPYLHLEKLVTNTQRTLSREIPNTTEDYKGKQVGSVSCTFHINGTNKTVSLPITDMDTTAWDYTWGKIILPFANEFTGWSLPASGSDDYDKIITGWEITRITGGTPGTFTTTGDDAYNFADRDCTAKDLYTKNNYVWAQGGYYVVPTGVTNIEFTAHIANAYFLCDPYPDVSYSSDYKTPAYIGNELSGDTYNGKTVYHTLTDVYSKMEDKQNPADQAIVLVGNYHINTYATSGNTTDKNVWPIANSGTITYQKKASTIMSIDADNNQVPDYAFVSALIYSTGRAWCPPLRFDFVCCPGLGNVSYTRAGCMANISILHSKGWFESTETSYLYFGEYEVRPQGFYYSNSPLILNGGYFKRIIDGSNLGNTGNNNNFSYFMFGGKVYIAEFKPGHMNENLLGATYSAKPVNVCGGQIEQCCMTSLTYAAKSILSGNAHFFCNGGNIQLYMGADQGQLKGDITAKIDHALIDEFYGGGNVANYTAGQISGNITTTIKNSHVKFFVAGPKFGDMTSDKTITTSATNTIFGEYYGAGYGGTSLVEASALPDGTQNPKFGNTDVTYNRDFTTYYTNKRLTYEAQYGTVVGYRFRFFTYAGGGVPGGQNGVAGFLNKYATLSLASTKDVCSTLKDCTIEGNFYGGGCQGKVDGTITNTLTDCTIGGSVFGGGYKAAVTPIYVYPTTQPTYSVFKAQLGLYTPFGTVEPETYTWVSGTDGAVNGTTIGTSVDMTQMGKVTGAITLTINGGTVGENVFGGGNESPSGSTTTVTINDNAKITGNVFGGANKANVGGNSVVDVNAGSISQVFGANNLSGTKSGTVTVNINQADEKTTSITNVFGGGLQADYSGDPVVNINGGTVTEAVYGGGALANTGNTTVNLLGGTVKDVYGGGLGRQQEGTAGEDGYVEGIAAKVGSTTVNVGSGTVTDGVATDIAGNCVITGSVFGCNNLNGTPTGNATVNVYKTNPQPGAAEGAYHVAAVYGGGNQAAYTPTCSATTCTDSTHVEIFGCDNSVAYVYGGGNAAPVPATHLVVHGGDFDWVFGGGNGAGEGNPGANVGYQTYPDGSDFATRQTYKYGSGRAVTVIHDGKINHLFGGSNTKGNIREVALSRLNDEKNCDFVMGEAYAAGNQAFMDGKAIMEIGCIPGMGEIYGGAKAADINADVDLTITGGTFSKVFGGNNISGKLNGSITVNIDETGCKPVKIDQLYGCGNQAPYSIYGYNDDGTVRTSGDSPKASPVVNIISFTSIGEVYGGGLGQSAKVVGNPTVNVNVIPGRKDTDSDNYLDADADAIGTIGTVFGGGNAAPVVGNTHVNIGTETPNAHLTTPDTKVDASAEITGNVYGGGLGSTAVVQGTTHVQIGPKCQP